MNNNTSLKIVIAETSVIIRSGLTAVLKRIPNLNAHPIEVSSPESLQNYIHMHPADIIIINPTFGGWFDLPAFKAEHGKSGIKYIAMVCSVIDNNILKEYDENFAMCDDVDVIASKINHLLHTEEEEEKDSEQETLSQREKEIITCVVKGMTNKAIADKLYLSIHTVITHQTADTFSGRAHHLRYCQQAGRIERHQGLSIRFFRQPFPYPLRPIGKNRMNPLQKYAPPYGKSPLPID